MRACEPPPPTAPPFIRTRAAALLPALTPPAVPTIDAPPVPAVDPNFAIGGSGLADQLLGAALNLARTRLVELRGTTLGSVPDFAAAVGVPGFGDPGGQVAALLHTASAQLDLVPSSLSAGDFAGAAFRVGAVPGAMRDAVALIPGAATLTTLLGARLSWPPATGILQQLGLSTGRSRIDGVLTTARILPHAAHHQGPAGSESPPPPVRPTWRPRRTLGEGNQRPTIPGRGAARLVRTPEHGGDPGPPGHRTRSRRARESFVTLPVD